LNTIVTLSPDEKQGLRQYVAVAYDAVALSWPMKKNAYRNPLRGCEHLPFDDAIREAAKGRIYSFAWANQPELLLRGMRQIAPLQQ
jgi:hypothetical protein